MKKILMLHIYLMQNKAVNEAQGNKTETYRKTYRKYRHIENF